MSTVALIKEFIPGASDTLISAYLTSFDAALPCLESYPQDVQDLTLALAVAHLLDESGSQQVTSEKTRTGASATYKEITGEGLLSTRFGVQLSRMPSSKCITALLTPSRFGKSLTPRYCR